MTLYYSASNRAFYDSSINFNMPSDIVEITQEQHQSLLNGQGQGKVISSDANGNPILTDRPAPTTAQLQAQLVQSAKKALQQSDITISRIIEAVIDGNTTFNNPDVVAWSTYRKALRNIIANPSLTTVLPTAPAYPQGT